MAQRTTVEKSALIFGYCPGHLRLEFGLSYFRGSGDVPRVQMLSTGAIGCLEIGGQVSRTLKDHVEAILMVALFDCEQAAIHE